MAPLDAGLPQRVAAAVRSAQRLAGQMPSIVAVALVGSWARGAGRPDSDVDLVVLCAEPSELLGSNDWITVFDRSAFLIRANDFGAIQERRLEVPTGLVIEVGIGQTSWAGTTPVDPGTERVIRDGLVSLYDPHALLKALLAAVPPTETQA